METDSKNAIGFSLLHVMVMLAAASSLMLMESRFSKHHSDYKALEFTLSQTESVLNAAFAHLQEQGEWPRGTSGHGCVVPFQRLGFTTASIVNGWGEIMEARCVGHGISRNFVLVQRIPQKWSTHLRARLDGVQTQISSGSEFVELTVTMNRSGGVLNTVQFDSLDQNGTSAVFDLPQGCATPVYFTGLSSVIAYSYSSQLETYISGFTRTFNGFTASNTDASGRMRARYSMYRYRNDRTITTLSAHQEVDSESPLPPHLHLNVSGDLPDGNMNAHYECVYGCNGNAPPVKVAFFSWCDE